MPLYDFKCATCGATQAEFRRLDAWDDPMACPHCKAPMLHDLVAQHSAVRGDRPRELQSMGFVADAEDVAEHRRRFPDVELRMDGGCAIPVVRSLGQKRAYLKASGYVDVKDYT